MDIRMTARIHPTAVIEAGAQLGAEVTVGPFTYIAAEVQVGDRCVLGPHVTLLGHTRLGQHCQVHAGAVLGDLPQDLAFKGEISQVQIGDRCVIREGVTIHRGTKAGTVTTVGHDCLLMANSHLAHNVQLGNRVIVANGALLAGYVEVGDRAFISGNCLIHQFTRIGRLAMVSGGAALKRDVPPFCITPALAFNQVMGLNVIGLRRAGFRATDRNILKAALTTLYRSGLNVSQAVEKLTTDFDSPLVEELCQFIRASKSGICHFVGGEKRNVLDLDNQS